MNAEQAKQMAVEKQKPLIDYITSLLKEGVSEEEIEQKLLINLLQMSANSSCYLGIMHGYACLLVQQAKQNRISCN